MDEKCYFDSHSNFKTWEYEHGALSWNLPIYNQEAFVFSRVPDISWEQLSVGSFKHESMSTVLCREIHVSFG
jgi:hypothetical protein